MLSVPQVSLSLLSLYTCLGKTKETMMYMLHLHFCVNPCKLGFFLLCKDTQNRLEFSSEATASRNWITVVKVGPYFPESMYGHEFRQRNTISTVGQAASRIVLYSG